MALACERAPVEPRSELDVSRLISSPKNNPIMPPNRYDTDSLKSSPSVAPDVYALLPRATEKSARICAEMLTSSGHMTQSLAFAFLARGDCSSLIALAGAQTLPSSLLLHRASTGTSQEARAIASRAHLDPLILNALCDRHDPVLDYLIAESPTLTDAHRVVDRLLMRAKKDKKLATHLLERDDLTFYQRARLFDVASSNQRTLLIREAVEEARETPSHDRPPRECPASLRTALEQNNRDDVLSALAASCGMSAPLFTSRPRFDHPDGAIAALAGLALELELKDIHRILELIGVDPIMKLRPGGAVDLLEQLTHASAKKLFDAINAPHHGRRHKTGKDQSDRSQPSFPFVMDAVA